MGTKSTTSTTNEPPAWAEPLFTQSAGEAQRLYNQGTGFNVYQGPTFAQPSQATQQGIQGLIGAAGNQQAQQLGTAPGQAALQVFGGGGVSAGSQPAMQFGNQVMTGQFNPATNQFDQALRNVSNPGTQQAGLTYRDAAQGGLGTNTGNLYQNVQNSPYSQGESSALQTLRNVANPATGINTNNQYAQLGQEAQNNPYVSQMNRTAQLLGQTGQTGDNTLRGIESGRNDINTVPFANISDRAFAPQAGDRGLQNFAAGLNGLNLDSQYQNQITGADRPGNYAYNQINDIASGRNGLDLSGYQQANRQAQQANQFAQNAFDPFRTGAQGIDQGLLGALAGQGQQFDPSRSQLSSIATGQSGINTGVFDQLRGQATGQTGADSTVNNFVNGRMEVSTNALDQLRGQLGQGTQADSFFSDMVNGQGQVGVTGLGRNAQEAGRLGQQSRDNLGGLASGTGLPDTSRLGELSRLSQATLPGSDALNDIVSGRQSISTLPGLQSVRNRAEDLGGQANTLFGGIARGQVGATGGAEYQDIYNRAGQDGAAEQYLTGMARGDNLSGNPFFQQLLDKDSAKIADQVAAQFGSSGRYGSGANQGVMAEELGNFRLRGLSENYDRERGYQMDAIRQLEDAQNRGLDQQMQAVQGKTGVEGMNIQNRLAAAGQLQGARERGLGLEQSLLGEQANVQQQNLANRQNAATTLGNQRMQQINQAGNLAGQQIGAQQQNNQTQIAAQQANTNAQQQGLGLQQQGLNSIANIQGQNVNRQMQAAQQQNQDALSRTGLQADIGGQIANIQGQDRGRQLDAAQQANQMGLARTGLAADIAGQGAQFQNQNIQNQADAAQTLEQQRQAGLGLQGQLTGQQLQFQGQNVQNQMQAAQQQAEAQRQLAQQLLTGTQAQTNAANQNLQNQMSATGQITNAQQAGNAQQASLLNSLANVRQGERGQQLDALNAQRTFAGQDQQRALAAEQARAGFEGQNIQNQMDAAQARQQGQLNSGIAQGNLQNQAGNLWQGGLAQALQAVGGQTNVQNQNLQNRMTAAQQQAQIGAGGQDRLLNAIQGQQGADQQNAALQLQGAAGMQQYGQNLFNNQLQGAQGLYNAQNQNLLNRLAGGQQAADIAQQGLATQLGYINALPTLQENRIFGSNLNLQAGAMQDQAAQQQINSDIQRFYENDMQPWTRLGGLQAAAQGAAGPYGSSVSASRQPFNPLSLVGLLGGFMGI